MRQNTVNNNSVRLFKNTFFMYIRTAVVLILSLYITRLILNELGEFDYGIYSLIGSVVVLFTFINSSITQAVQRFLTIELGKNDSNQATKVFSTSVIIQVCFGFIFFLLCETIGLYLILDVLNVGNRGGAAFWVFQFSILVFLLNVLRVPYEATVIAHERLSFYAIVSVFETIFKLIICFLLIYFSDRLIAYSGLLVIVSSFTFLAYYVYCKHNFELCRFRLLWDQNLFKQMLSFSGWSMSGSITNVGTQSLFGVMLNFFYGVMLNTALGISNQINAALSQFISNFQTSFRPQIIKAYGQNDIVYFKKLISSTSKFSYLLALIPSTILIYNMPIILKLWLGQYPEYTVAFSRIIVICTLFDALTGSYYCALTANGKIKLYQIAISFSFMLDIILSWIIMLIHVNPTFILIPRIVTRGIINMIIGLYFMNKNFEFDFKNYLKTVIKPLVIFTVILSLSQFLLTIYFDSWILLIASIIDLIILMILFSPTILSKSEKDHLKILLKTLLTR